MEEKNGIYKALIEAIKEIREKGVSISGEYPVGGKKIPYRTIADALDFIPDILLKHGIFWECKKRDTQHFETSSIDKYGTVKPMHTWVTTIDYSLIYLDGSRCNYSFDGQGEHFTKGCLTAQTTALRNFLLTVCGIPSGDLDEIQTAEKNHYSESKPIQNQNQNYNKNNFSKKPTDWSIFYDFKNEAAELNNNHERYALWQNKFLPLWNNLDTWKPEAKEAIQNLLTKFSVNTNVAV